MRASWTVRLLMSFYFFGLSHVIRVRVRTISYLVLNRMWNPGRYGSGSGKRTHLKLHVSERSVSYSPSHNDDLNVGCHLTS